MRRSVGFILAALVTASVGGCRSSGSQDLVEAELRAREHDLRVLRAELDRSDAINAALQRELRHAPHVTGSPIPPPEGVGSAARVKTVVLGRQTGGFEEDGFPGDEALQDSIVDSALADFPVIGDQIRGQVTSVRGTGIALIIGVLVTLYGGLGVANALQNAMNRVWAVPMRHRPGFFPRIVRSLALIGLLGAGILVTSFFSQVGGTPERASSCAYPR